ncbi:MAG: undecaprenyldiphospho-muramoylpentapeptide beta-N-acetylglucosaminyltransferase [Candidatus Moranbacteria bacterium]|nr:undecaprenyldiphospho-muramoylpentapeptide beta-N-acetylglucosaminyltransferase [Candidatus Moranbacteria bacterium]
MKIILAGGGTGGHLMPLVAVARKIKEKAPDTTFVFVGPKGQMEDDIIGKEGIPMRAIATGKLRRYFSLSNFTDIFRILFGILQCMKILLAEMPDAVFSKGGYASIPVVFVAWMYRIPIMIHESDAVPGMANGILSKFADRVAVTYPEAEKEFPSAQVVVTGNPIREDVNLGDVAKARQMFELTESRKTIFVYGGSQGAKIINDKIVELLPELLKRYQVIHQTGQNNFEDVKHMAGELGIKAGREGYHPLSFIGEELKDIFAVSDLVISRAGATSIAEIAANGKPAILIPIDKSANNHQRMNAYAIAKFGGCVVLEENNLGENLFLSRINEILENDEFRQKLATDIKIFYHPDAADKIADGVLGMIN